MASYSTREVSRLLGLPPARIRAYARAGLLDADRGGERGEWRFSFQDLVLLRTAKGLADANVPLRRISRALLRLRRELPADRPLTELRITADGDTVVVRDGRAAWSPESGQLRLDFLVSDLVGDVAPLVTGSGTATRGADDWYDAALEMEADDPDGAAEAYERALALDATHGEAHINLGRLLQVRGRPREAESHYRQALEALPGHATAAFNLGTVLEEQGRGQEAVRAYEAALAADPGLADAHFNLSRIFERLGERTAALRHLRSYRALIAAS
ncbi:MAG: tetratricopeptide repeat protein [Longimicrobiales bacterium]